LGSNAPYSLATLASVSERSAKLKSNFFAKAALSSGLSYEMPRIAAFFFSNWALRSRNPQPSAVHPGVSALG
jgi:hypothetical protein